MPALADVQAGIRDALVRGESAAVAPLLSGGARPLQRLAIHQRHYAASLTTALLNRFPATVWLVGSQLVSDAARAFVREHPPSRPCIAEYGDLFPAFLAARPAAAPCPYLAQFVDLEWHLGRLALAVDLRPTLDVSVLDPAALADTCVAVQPTAHFLHLTWALDELIALYLTGREPEQFSLTQDDVWLEVRGQRGELRMNRLTRAVFTFRTRVAGGTSLGDAARAALDVEPAFDAGQALSALFADGLVHAISGPTKEAQT